jgi:HEAT repeat protein
MVAIGPAFFASGLIPGLSRKPTRKESTVRWKRWISVTPLAMIAVAPVATSIALTSAAHAADDSGSVTRLSGIVNAPPTAVSTDDRDAAAVQLVNRDAPAARAAVQNALKNNGNTLAQIAIAKAIAAAERPSDTLIPALGNLLGSNAALTDAAAQALASYPGNPAAFQQLKTFADIANTPQPVRESVIRAIGQLIDKPVAEYLLNLAEQPRQSDAIQSAALAALAEMTGENDFGKDLQQWNQWWETMRLKTPDQFRSALLESRARRFKLLKQRNRQLAESTRTLLISDYEKLPPALKPTVLVDYLNDPAPEVRSVGVTLVGVYLDRKPPTDDVRKRLLQLIGDTDEKVRSDVVKLLLTLNDPASRDALIKQLGIEKDPQVAQTIAQILGNLKDANAAPGAARALVPMLHDSNPDNAIAAAKALAGLGQNVRIKDAKFADELSDQLRTLLQKLNNQPRTNALRAACISALAELRDPKSLDTFLDCLVNPPETAEVRIAALVGLRNLGDARANQIVLECLKDQDPGIRLEAAHALTTVATPDQDFRMYDYMTQERDQNVAQALWMAFKALYPKETQGQLEHWAAQFNTNNDPAKEIATREALNDVLKRARDALGITNAEQAKHDQQIAFNEQAMAAAMMSVKPTPQVTQAIAHLQLALDYWRGPGKGTGGSDENLETLIRQILDDKLIAEQWAPACTFAAEQIAVNGVYQESVGPPIRDKIDALIKSGNTTAAQSLIDAALAMKPPLDTRYLKDIQRAQNDLKTKPPGP